MSVPLFSVVFLRNLQVRFPTCSIPADLQLGFARGARPVYIVVLSFILSNFSI